MDHPEKRFDDIRYLVLDILEKSETAEPGTVYVISDEQDKIEVHFWGKGQFSIPTEHKKTELGAFLVDAFKFICGQHKVVQHSSLEGMLTAHGKERSH